MADLKCYVCKQTFVWWNLRIIPAKINLSKGNRAWPNMWEIEN
jgi:hypothetical protein